MDDESPKEARKNVRREALRGLGALALLFLLMFWLAGGFHRKVGPGPAAQKPAARGLNVQKTERRTFPLVMEQAGTVRSRTEAQVSARIMAQVKEISVREGDAVVGSNGGGGAPSVLARLDDRDIQAKLRQARAQSSAMDRALETAKAKLGAARAHAGAAKANRDRTASDFRRYEDLKKYAAATGQQLDQARAQKNIADAEASGAGQEVLAAQSEIARIQAQKEQAEAAAAEARAMLDYTVIQAPFTGKVVRKLVNVGDMASPGQPLFFLETPSHPEFHASVSESLLPRLRVGEKAAVRIDALDRVFQGEIREIVPMSDPATRTVLVKVDLPAEPDLVNGLFGRFEAPYGQVERLVAPVRALRRVGQLDLVDVVDSEGRPLRRFVTLGERRGDVVEVLSGLKENEEVIVP